MEINLFHGTTKQNSDKLINSSFRRPVDPGDLGTGVYAFLNDKTLAFEFARRYSSDVSILKLTLKKELTDDEVLDLDDEDNLKYFLEIREKILTVAIGRIEKSNSKRNCIDGVVVDYLLKDFPQVALVKKRTYTPLLAHKINGRPLISNYYNGCEVCIRKIDLIDKELVQDG
ncbi:TPA_asm: hypothetical protein GJA98_14905 [Listeria monocytogenes]|nr:hypothetical protein [Listeria monocytogenes]